MKNNPDVNYTTPENIPNSLNNVVPNLPIRRNIEFIDPQINDLQRLLIPQNIEADSRNTQEGNAPTINLQPRPTQRNNPR